MVCDGVLIGRYIVAFGLENGSVVVCKLVFSEDGVGSLDKIGEVETGGMKINSVKWRPAEEGRVSQLATCGDDWSVRVFDVEH
jgi:hypothetical protein